jgi:hypothetical protein
MTKRKQKKTTDVATAVLTASNVPTAAAAQPEGLRRATVLISEADLKTLQEAERAGATVTVFSVGKAKGLTDAQRASRKAYRLRPDVHAKQQAYRAARAKRIRAEKAAAKAAAAVQPTQVEQNVP